jgi:hypothetical protein
VTPPLLGIGTPCLASDALHNHTETLMANPKRRSITQMTEEASYRILRQKLPMAWVIHDYKPDYGIDCVVELFDFVDGNTAVAETLGEHIYVQLKASGSVNYSVRRVYSRRNVAKGPLLENRAEFTDVAVASFQLDVSDLMTVELLGPGVPVLLILIDTATERAFFVCLNDYLEKIIQPEDPGFATKDSKLIHIPVQNELLPNEPFLTPLRVYGKRAKMYGAFNRFAFQHKEIQRRRGKALVAESRTSSDDLEMIRVFAEKSLRQDIWRGHDFWAPIGDSQHELEDVRDSLAAGIEPDGLELFKEFCDEYVWRRLVNLGSMYEELVREWYLPTVLAQMTSYPTAVFPTKRADL